MRHTLGQNHVGKTTGEGNNGALGRGVVKEIRPANICVDASIIYYGGSLLHVGEDVFGKIEVRAVIVSFESS